MPWIPVHKTWQMKLLWPMDPPSPSTRAEMPWIPVHKLGRWTYFGQWTPLPSTRVEMPWITVHNTWQMNLLWQWTPPVPEQRWLAYCSSIHHFWDTPQYFLKTHFSLENDFLSFLELQKSLPVSFQGADHNGKGLKVLTFAVSEIPNSIF